jgi:uncharacterized LabA/DUF88 family protein
MNIMAGEKRTVVYVFIDASNLWAAQKVKGRMFDFEKLKHFLKGRHSATAIKVFYYTAYPADGTRDYSLDGKHKFLTFLKKGLGFVVRKKELKRISVLTEAGETIEEKGNMDVEMTIDAMHHMERYDIAVFFSGDSDFLALVNYVKRNGKKIYIYSSRNNVSEELRTGSDGYTDVLKITEDIWGKELKYREQK